LKRTSIETKENLVTELDDNNTIPSLAFQLPNDIDMPVNDEPQLVSIQFIVGVNSTQYMLRKQFLTLLKKSNSPLFPNAKITEIESSILVFAFAIRHRLTKEATEDLLTLLTKHLPMGISVPTSTYLLRKKFSSEETSKIVTTHYMCEECNTLLGSDKMGVCEECNTTSSKDNVFLTFDLGMLISDALTDTRLSSNLYNNLMKRNAQPSGCSIDDIVNGCLYKQLPQAQFDFTCLLNTDGVPAFKSSNQSIWPVFVSVNELDYKIRRKNTLLVGLWIGNCKPVFDVFLDPIMKICNRLQENPVKWNHDGKLIESFVRFPIFTADSVARCQVQGLNQFNGAYGCPWCMLKGETLWITNRSHKWIYPCDKSPLVMRNKESFLEHARKLKSELDNGNSKCKHVYGVNAASQLLLLKDFDIVNGFVFDVMHTAFLGVTKSLTSMWMDSSNSDKLFYIGTKKTEIDRRLRMFSVPFESSRAIRPISDSSHWKASEWRVWTYICPLVLKGILPDAYLTHFQKYSTSMMIFNDERIGASDLDFAKTQLEQFVFQVENFYSAKANTFNIHALLHVADCVRNWGPLWAYSAFQFEHFNGILLKNFKGSQSVIKQIAARSIETMQLLKLGREAISNDHVRYFYEALIDGRRFFVKYQRVKTGVTFVGPSKPYKFSVKEAQALIELGLPGSSGLSFRRCIVFDKMFTTCDSDSKKRNNSVVLTVRNELLLVKRLVYIADANVGIIIGNAIQYDLDNVNPYLVRVKGIGKTTKIVNIDDLTRQKFIVQKSVIISSVIRLPNVTEAE